MKTNALLVEDNCFVMAFLETLTHLKHAGQQKYLK